MIEYKNMYYVQMFYLLMCYDRVDGIKNIFHLY